MLNAISPTITENNGRAIKLKINTRKDIYFFAQQWNRNNNKKTAVEKSCVTNLEQKYFSTTSPIYFNSFGLWLNFFFRFTFNHYVVIHFGFKFIIEFTRFLKM